MSTSIGMVRNLDLALIHNQNKSKGNKKITNVTAKTAITKAVAPGKMLLGT